MAEQVTNYKCPACGGSLRYDGAAGKLKCDFCDSLYDVEQFEAQMQGKNAAAAAAMAAATANGGKQTADGSADWGAEGMKSYTCPSCGAQLICDQTTAATCCPYCGNQTIVPGHFDGSLKPDYVMPFKTDKEQAKAALKEHYKGKRLLPNAFISGNHIEKVQGVYVPFWLYDSQVHGEGVYDAEKSTTTRSGDKKTTVTDYYEVRRAGSLSFRQVPVDASTKMPDRHMDSIEPFDYRELKPFSMSYMPGFLADRYDEDSEKCKERMESRCRSAFESELCDTVVGYTRVSTRSCSSDVQVKKTQYAMLPVWLLATKWNGKSFLFAMNGQSGKLVGDLPMDKRKFWGWLLGVAAVLIGLMQLVNLFVREEPWTGLGWLMITVVLPLLASWVNITRMVSQLNSVSTRAAGGYISGGGLKLLSRSDNFLRSETKTEVVKKSEPNKK